MIKLILPFLKKLTSQKISDNLNYSKAILNTLCLYARTITLSALSLISKLQEFIDNL